jgi:prevent-host-death family protein
MQPASKLLERIIAAERAVAPAKARCGRRTRPRRPDRLLQSGRIQFAGVPAMASEIISLTEFKANAAGWVEKLQSQPPIVLTQNGKGRAVVQSYEEYERARFELAVLLRVNHALADDRAGRTIPHATIMREMRELLKKRLAEHG